MPLPQEKYYTVEDFYNMPDDIRAELIEGQIVYMASPSRLHQDISHELDFAITSYIKSKGGKCRVYTAPFGVQLNDKKDTVLEPDISVICDTDKLTPRGCVGAPDWIIEIVSPSSRQMDYYKKLFQYHTAGVREYLVADPEKGIVTVYDFEKDSMEEYTFGEKVPVGIYDGYSIKVQ